MCLFDLIKKDYGIWLAAHRLCKLTALVISHIARRRTHQPADRMTLLILAHVDSGHHVLIVEKELGEGLRKLSLSDTGGTHEQE